MYGKHPRDLYVPYETAALRESLKKHAHRVQIQEGIRRHVLADEYDGEEKTSSALVGVTLPPAARPHSQGVPQYGRDRSQGFRRLIESVPGVSGSGTPRKAVRTKPKEKPKEPQPAPPPLRGAVMLQVPSETQCSVRSDWNSCFAAMSDPAIVQKFLLRKCPWKPSALLGVGDWNKHAAPITRNNFEHLEWDFAPRICGERGRSPERASSPKAGSRGASPQRSASPDYKPPFTFIGCSADQTLDWKFLKHIPGADQWRITRQAAIRAYAADSFHCDERLLQVLCNDVSVLLLSRHPRSKLPSIIDIVDSSIHRQTEREKECGKDGGSRPASAHSSAELRPGSAKSSTSNQTPVGARLAGVVPITIEQLLDATPFPIITRWQRVLKPSDGSPDALGKKLARALAQKKEWFQVVASEEGMMDTQSTIEVHSVNDAIQSMKKRRSLVDVGVVGSGPRERWLGVLPVARDLPTACNQLSLLFRMELNVERLGFVMCAIERAASYRMCGEALASTFERLTISTASQEEDGVGFSLEPRHAVDGLSPDWVIQVLSEAMDEDKLEEGDCVRLLTQLASGMVSAETFCEEAWLALCAVFDLRLSFGNEKEGKRISDFNLAATASDIGPHRKRALVKHFHDAQTMLAKSAVTQTCAADCNPLVLEVLLQLVGGAGDELAMQMLWQFVGWDSPTARRMLRRMCRAFDRYARNGELSISGFVKFCHDAGWSTSRDNAAKQSRFTNIFENTIGPEVAGAHFIEFLSMIEVIMKEVLQPQSRLENGTGVWQAMEVAASKLAGGATAASKGRSAGTVKKTHHKKPKHIFSEKDAQAVQDAANVPEHVDDISCSSPRVALPPLGTPLAKPRTPLAKPEDTQGPNEVQVQDLDQRQQQLQQAAQALGVAIDCVRPSAETQQSEQEWMSSVSGMLREQAQRSEDLANVLKQFGWANDEFSSPPFRKALLRKLEETLKKTEQVLETQLPGGQAKSKQWQARRIEASEFSKKLCGKMNRRQSNAEKEAEWQMNRRKSNAENEAQWLSMLRQKTPNDEAKDEREDGEDRKLTTDVFADGSENESFDYDDEEFMKEMLNIISLVFNVHTGAVSGDLDLYVEQMTVEEAKVRCKELTGCSGFSFEGPENTTEPANIHFKSGWGECDGSEEWTSFQVDRKASRDLAVAEGKRRRPLRPWQPDSDVRPWQPDADDEYKPPEEEEEEDSAEAARIAAIAEAEAIAAIAEAEAIADEVFPEICVPKGNALGWQVSVKGEVKEASSAAPAPAAEGSPTSPGPAVPAVPAAPKPKTRKKKKGMRSLHTDDESEDEEELKKAARKKNVHSLLDS